MPRHQRTALLAALAGALVGAPAAAQEINTGDATGAYHGTFCPRLEGALRQARFPHTCKTSEGTGENLRRVLADPRQVGFGQLDILALEGALAGDKPPVAVMRRDDARECLFAVTRNKDLLSWGHIAGNAARLRFILPPQGSGSFGTFRFLRSLDPEGLGRATQVTHAKDTDEAIRQSLAADDTVTLFVQFPDPDNVRFRLVNEQGGHFVPVIDRAILRPQVGGEKIYFAQETQVANAQWSKAGVKVVTACTPLAIFTGAPERIADARAAQDQRDLIATVRALKPEVLLPPEGAFARFWRTTRELSGGGTEELIRYSEEAREKALPYWERARQATEKAIEAAKPMVDKAAEESKKLIDKAKEEAKELMEKARPESAKPAPKQ
jgi:hypothetical protein